MPATMNNNALLTLDALAGCGVVLPAEIRASLDVSLALKASELGVREFFLWGRVRTQSGTDYYVARAENGKRVDHDGVVVANVGAKFYYSQDGMEWLDLVPPEEDVTMEKAAELKCWLTGDPAHVFTVYEEQPIPEPPTPPPEPELAEGEEPPPPPEPEDPPEPLPPLEFAVTELQLLLSMATRIDDECVIAPVGMHITDANGHIVYNPLFHMKYPEQLASYAKTAVGGSKTTLKEEPNGTWGVTYDTFKRLAVVRSFAWPGYFAYYSDVSNTTGGIYFGDGRKNEDVAFTV